MCKEEYEQAIKKLISERDCAINDMKHITFNRVGKVPQSMCDTCRENKDECMKFYMGGEEIGCIWSWRGVEK